MARLSSLRKGFVYSLNFRVTRFINVRLIWRTGKMSFGFSPNDIISLLNIAHKAYRGWKASCGEYADVTSALDGLLVVLERIQAEAKKDECILARTESERNDLKDILSNCKPTLRELHSIVTRYHSLGTSREKNWDKLRFGVKNLSDLRAKLNQHVTLLTAYLETVGLGALGRIERDVQAIPDRMQNTIEALAAEIRAGRREGSVMTTYDDDEKEVWRQFRRELIGEGMRSSVIHRFKPVIKKHLRELADNGLLEEQPHSDQQSNIDQNEDHQRPEKCSSAQYSDKSGNTQPATLAEPPSRITQTTRPVPEEPQDGGPAKASLEDVDQYAEPESQTTTNSLHCLSDVSPIRPRRTSVVLTPLATNPPSGSASASTSNNCRNAAAAVAEEEKKSPWCTTEEIMSPALGSPAECNQATTHDRDRGPPSQAELQAQLYTPMQSNGDLVFTTANDRIVSDESLNAPTSQIDQKVADISTNEASAARHRPMQAYVEDASDSDESLVGESCETEPLPDSVKEATRAEQADAMPETGERDQRFVWLSQSEDVLKREENSDPDEEDPWTFGQWEDLLRSYNNVSTITGQNAGAPNSERTADKRQDRDGDSIFSAPDDDSVFSAPHDDSVSSTRDYGNPDARSDLANHPSYDGGMDKFPRRTYSMGYGLYRPKTTPTRNVLGLPRTYDDYPAGAVKFRRSQPEYAIDNYAVDTLSSPRSKSGFAQTAGYPVYPPSLTPSLQQTQNSHGHYAPDYRFAPPTPNVNPEFTWDVRHGRHIINFAKGPWGSQTGSKAEMEL